jgi:hypothetical protein
MSLRLFIIILLLPFLTKAQTQKGLFGFYDNRDRNQFFTICVLQAISGAARGYEQTVAYHYSSFKRIHPNINDQFFDPAISWKNKYKNGDPNEGSAYFLSTSVLVWTTDFKHLMDMTSNVPNYICITLPFCTKHGNLKWTQIASRIFIIFITREIAFNTVYSVIYK